jgi:hypothetical protein
MGDLWIRNQTEWRDRSRVIGTGTYWDWDSVSNPCWSYSSEAAWLGPDRLGPALAGATVVPLSSTGADFYTKVKNTIAAASGRVVIQLEAGRYTLTEFRMIGSSGDPKYAFGLWDANLQGFLGRGADQTFIELAPDSMDSTLLASIAAMGYAAAGGWAVLQTGVMRLDGASASSPIILGGITFRAGDQQDIADFDASFDTVGVAAPQPAPHIGLVFYPGAYVYMSHCRFQAFGRAVTSAPPFECANFNSQRGRVTIWNTESDGRLSDFYDAARPVRSAVMLANDEYSHRLIECHLHDSNVSRYAVNDENYNTRGVYQFVRSIAERITINRNTDPALNGGASLGGWTDASCLGWESCAGTILLEDSIISMDNPRTDSGQKPMHLQLTMTGGVTRTGGTLTVRRTEFRSTGQPQLDGWLTMRLDDATQWFTEGPANRMFIYHPVSGARLTAHIYTGTWPPSVSALAALGVTSATHYIAQRI